MANPYLTLAEDLGPLLIKAIDNISIHIDESFQKHGGWAVFSILLGLVERLKFVLAVIGVAVVGRNSPRISRLFLWIVFFALGFFFYFDLFGWQNVMADEILLASFLGIVGAWTGNRILGRRRSASPAENP